METCKIVGWCGNTGCIEGCAAQKAVEAEREACAKICDISPDLEDKDILGGEEGAQLCRALAKSIRMRSKGNNYAT